MYIHLWWLVDFVYMFLIVLYIICIYKPPVIIYFLGVIEIFNPGDIVSTIYTCKCEDIYKISKEELALSLVTVYVFESAELRDYIFNEISKTQISEINVNINKLNTDFDKLHELGVKHFAIVDPDEIHEYKDYLNRSLCILTVFVSKLHKSLYLKFIKKAKEMGVI